MPSIYDEMSAPLSSSNRLAMVRLKQSKIKAMLRLADIERAENEQRIKHITPEIVSQEIAFQKANPLRDFIRESWAILEPGNPYVPGFHIDAIAEHLEACSRGDLKNLVINIPPRFMKSLLVCVMWFCWTWTHRPYTRWMFSSYSTTFALRDSDKCRTLIKSDWYQSRYGDKFQVSKSQDTKSRFNNNQLGFRLSTGVRGQGTGEGADFIIADDPHKVLEAESTKVVEATVDWWHRTMYNRTVNPETTVRIIVMQRISEEDLTGDILAKELKYEHLCLPMAYESDHPTANTPRKPTTLGVVNPHDVSYNPTLKVGTPKKWIDPRDLKAADYPNDWFQEWRKKYFKKKAEGDGQLLFPEFLTQEKVDDLEKTLEVYGASAQLQQRPTPKGGLFFKRDLFKKMLVSNYNPNDYDILRYWDKAGTQGGGDWTVGTLMARSKSFPFSIVILDVVRKRESVYNRMALIEETTDNDYEVWTQSGQIKNNYKVVIEMEGGSSGTDLSIIERDQLADFEVITEKPTGSKTTRARPFKMALEAGRVWYLENELWNKVYLDEFEKFIPDKEDQVDDQVDTTSGGYKHLVFGARTTRRESGGMRASNYSGRR